ncbi:restriction endonuclease [Streptococcus penaeicida]|uniref:Restriction endonuclease n=1 Tax=Streptococcus penaeicida TaxID=1765960 RepID=A0A2N8LC42_9STRE|nr:HIRAN domain-containing protein [Streptococcus penaeicida]PND47725.1 restriction endonuclease [Streptococcus penaeicida]
MNELMTNNNHGLIKYLQNRELGLVLPTPFERDIYLFETIVAGTSHIENIADIEAQLALDDKLVFYREPDNRFDPQAIKIATLKGDKIGYIPKKDNLIFSRLMDAGKELFGKITRKEKKGQWTKIEMAIYLHES